MLSSLQALAGAAPAPAAARSASFQPKFKPRAPRRGSAAPEETPAATQESLAAPDPSSPSQAATSAAATLIQAAQVATQPTPEPQVQKRAPAPRDVPSAPAAPPVTRQRSGKQPVTSVPASLSTPSFSTPAVLQPDTPEASDSSKGKRKRVSSYSAPRRRRVENVDEEIDPTRMTMKDIIRLAEAKDRRKQKEDAARKHEQAAEGVTVQREREQVIPLAPQVQIVDGKIVIDQQSMQVDARTLNTDDLGTYRRIEESSSKLNYHSYMKPVARERWKPEETETFYKAVQQFGTDFAVIERLFPGKNRKQIKAKYKKEERFNPRRLSDSILQPRADLAHYEKLVLQLMASSAADKGEDEFAFTWDVNAVRPTENASEPTEEHNEEHYENGEEIEDDPSYSDMADQSSAKKEESPPREFQPSTSEKLEAKDKEEMAVPPLFAYEMEIF